VQDQPQEPVGEEEPEDAAAERGHRSAAQQQPHDGVSRSPLPTGSGGFTERRILGAGLIVGPFAPEQGFVFLKEVSGEPVRDGRGAAKEPGQHLRATGRAKNSRSRQGSGSERRGSRGTMVATDPPHGGHRPAPGQTAGDGDRNAARTHGARVCHIEMKHGSAHPALFIKAFVSAAKRSPGWGKHGT